MEFVAKHAVDPIEHALDRAFGRRRAAQPRCREESAARLGADLAHRAAQAVAFGEETREAEHHAVEIADRDPVVLGDDREALCARRVPAAAHHQHRKREPVEFGEIVGRKPASNPPHRLGRNHDGCAFVRLGCKRHALRGTPRCARMQRPAAFERDRGLQPIGRGLEMRDEPARLDAARERVTRDLLDAALERSLDLPALERALRLQREKLSVVGNACEPEEPVFRRRIHVEPPPDGAAPSAGSVRSISRIRSRIGSGPRSG